MSQKTIKKFFDNLSNYCHDLLSQFPGTLLAQTLQRFSFNALLHIVFCDKSWTGLVKNIITFLTGAKTGSSTIITTCWSKFICQTKLNQFVGGLIWRHEPMDLSFLWISAQHAKILSLANKSLQYIPITDWLAPNTQLGHRITQIFKNQYPMSTNISNIKT